jgi:hypothetical protein
MRGIALVFTVAFVFASASLLVGEAAGQETDVSYPGYPGEYQQPPTDAVLQGIVTGPDGSPIEGAQVSASSYGSPEPMPAEDPADKPDDANSSSGTSDASYRYYGGYNSTSTGPDGRYVLGVYGGDNQVSVHHPAFVGQSLMLKVESGQSLDQDFTLEAYPEKTAHIVGKITDAKSGKALPQAGISVRSPLYGVYECSMPAGQSGGGSGGSVEPARDDAPATTMIAPYEPYGCAITLNADGTFEGRVTPGYSIISVYAYQDCTTTRDADGGGATTCGPEYLPWTRTLTLPANQTTRIDVALPSRPAPDATVSGYLLDGETRQAIPGASIQFSNQETYAWGSATTDGDGSYKIRLRSGYHSVSIYAPGYLSWEGILQVKAGSSDFDARLTPGQESGGGCCWLYGEKGDLAVGAPGLAGGMEQRATGANDAFGADESSGDGSLQYEDLGGGLGPYDAQASCWPWRLSEPCW